MKTEHLADLLRHNHVRASYIPPKAVRDLRDLTRRRRQLTPDATRERNRVEKLLEHVKVKIGRVLSDTFGVSEPSMLLALLEGHSTPEQIAATGPRAGETENSRIAPIAPSAGDARGTGCGTMNAG